MSDSIAELIVGLPPLVALALVAYEVYTWRRQSRFCGVISVVTALLSIMLLIVIVQRWYVTVWMDPNGAW